MAGNPLRRAVGVVLLLPDRHRLLETIDGETRGGKRFGAMRSRRRHHDRDLSQSQHAMAVHSHEDSDELRGQIRQGVKELEGAVA